MKFFNEFIMSYMERCTLFNLTVYLCGLNTLLIETYLSFIFQWHLLQPERWVVCVGELKIASGNHSAILSLPPFSLKRKRNLCSVLSKLWKFQLQRVWPLPLSRQRHPPRAEHFILFYSNNIKDTLLFKAQLQSN